MKTLALLIVTAIWGWTFVLVKEGVAEIGPLWFLALRFAIATGLALPLLARGLRDWARGALLGAILFLGYFFQTWGLVYTTAQKSGLITGLSVVLVPPIAWLWGQRTSRRTWAGVALAALGLSLLVLGGREPLGPTGFGDLLTIICALAFALYLVFLDRYTKTTDFLSLFLPQLGVVALLSLAGAYIWEAPTLRLSARTWQAILITGALASTLAFFVLTWVQRRSTAAYTAIVLASEPAFAALFGWLLLGEWLRGPQILGGGLIFLGIMIPQLKPVKRPD
ncbi:TPA: DMT family transporter [Candidatus Bipolaricaulota bacterium]|nr:DMT family transporter [Candidatus Bipolaricaulota bacterium]HIP99435.1 DMT family transporter [Candidatus Bipolaricaulota bacterium]